MPAPKSHNRQDAKRAYIESKEPVSLEVVAEQFKGVYGCSLNSLKKACAAEGWIEQRDEFWNRAAARAESRAITRASHQLEQIQQLQDKAAREALEMEHNDAGQAVGSFVKLGEYRRKLTGESRDDGITVNIGILNEVVEEK